MSSITLHVTESRVPLMANQNLDYSLADVFDRHFEHVKFDRVLAKGIYEFQIYMSTKNQDHIQFFGGNLLGVQVLRFLPREVQRFFDRVLRVDYDVLKTDIRKLTTIYQENSITADILNLTLMYLIHRFYSTPYLSDKLRLRAAFDCAMIFCYQTVIALTNNYFHYPADPKVAQAAYANLSNKNLIKQLGSWKRLCEYRSEAMIDPKGLNYERLSLFNDDIVITGVISDSQNRFKDVFRIYYGEFDRVHSSGESIGVNSATIVDVDGDVVLRERTKGVEPLINYMRSILNDPHGFIKYDLITVVADMNSNTSFRMVRSTLEWLAHAYGDVKTTKAVDKFVTDVLIQGMWYIDKNVPIDKRRDTPFILKTLMDMFLATRSMDPDLLSIREQGEKLLDLYARAQVSAEKAAGNKSAKYKPLSASLMTSTRTAIILYIILRATTGYHK